MNWQNATEISENVYFVGVRDWNRRLFDALIPLPRGTTYNSYVVIGENKKALIDTVNPGFERELEERIKRVTDPGDLDYIVMNHAEPDHAGAIPYLMSINQKAKLIATSRGAKMAQIFFHVPQDRILTIVDGDTVDLGRKTLRFIEAPMLHWPETMFTFLEQNGVLFPCDFFGLHVSQGLYDDQVEDMLVFAQRYFGEIMMPYSFNARQAMDKIRKLEIKMIAPSHGPVHNHPEDILSAYRKWAYGETKLKATIVYVTMWNSTEKMVKPFAEALTAEGIEVSVHNLAVADIADIAGDLVDSKAIVLGTPTVLSSAHPLAAYAAFLVKVLHPPAKYVAVLSSYGWGKGAIKHIQDILGPTKMEIVGTLEINGPPTDDDIKQIMNLGKALAENIKKT